MKKQKMPISNILIFLLVIVMFISLFYMASYFREKEENVRAENPVVFCQPPNVPPEEKECFFTTHTHYHLEIEIDGKEIGFGFEKGSLNSFHTHSDEHKIHWHGLLSADPISKQAKQLPTLTHLINEVIEIIDIGEREFNVFVNEKKISNPDNYTLDLKEEQTIRIIVV
jgi:hypothetical protein